MESFFLWCYQKNWKNVEIKRQFFFYYRMEFSSRIVDRSRFNVRHNSISPLLFHIVFYELNLFGLIKLTIKELFVFVFLVARLFYFRYALNKCEDYYYIICLTKQFCLFIYVLNKIDSV